jgi:lysophospholipase L1-like esterase
MTRLFPTALLLAALLLGSGCIGTPFGDKTPRDEQCPSYELGDGPSILAIGDSVFAWRNPSCATVPDLVAEQLDRGVKHKAANGARLSGGTHSLQRQWEPGPWEWVIMSGGGNDFDVECQCGVDCQPVLDYMIRPDARTGQLVNLVRQIQNNGSSTLIYGYPEVGDDAFYGFDECVAEIDELRRRQALLAELQPGVVFVDGRDAVSSDTPGAYDFDNVHPSREGRRRIAAQISAAILDSERKAGITR